MEETQKDGQDRRVLNLAADISYADEKSIPRLLLQIQEILDSFNLGSPQQIQAKLDLWSYDILEVIVVTLKQDFSKLLNGWTTAAKLATILAQSCIGLEPPESHNFLGVFLPSVAENLLMVSRRIQTKYIKTSSVLEDMRQELLTSFKAILDAVNLLFSAYQFLTTHVLCSPWLLQMLITDDPGTEVVVMATIQSANRMSVGVFAQLDEKVKHQILDELVYKLSASSDINVASTTTRTVLVICDSHPPTVQLLCTRYKGLRLLLMKWQGRGFNNYVKRLMVLLAAGSMHRAELERFHRAAALIQAAWKSFMTRRKLKRASSAMSRFQINYRGRKIEEEQRKLEEKVQAELRHMLLIQRRHAMRDLREKQLEMLTLLPAAEVQKHLEQEKLQSAVKIQALWRGHMTRKCLASTQKGVRETRAAICLQRGVRQWLKRIHNRRTELPMWQRPPGLTDERRVELQTQIQEWRESHPVTERSKEQESELHNKVQDLLRRNVIMSKPRRSSEQHRQALIAQLEVDSTLIIAAPTLSDVTEQDLENFVSHSVPVASKARHDHNEELRLLRQPWWRKLGDEYQDEKTAEELGDWRVF
ncbi:hypothetical protein NP493_630g00039 [Ridgeia piscesae]|uniref:IQ calmodulin-binding motif-containing protein 1 n=1 Tax=Ridgeia piscesae TaxID=27915 RepID=A0AAD9KSY9_RIDPI|nr:hypothetical protein NP493_630g00039 [Ridgeia piscesae]